MITVFYDGKCGLCSKEINHYRKIAPHGIFDWQDITESAGDFKKEGISLSEGLRLLHAKDHTGQMHVGVDALTRPDSALKWATPNEVGSSYCRLTGNMPVICQEYDRQGRMGLSCIKS